MIASRSSATATGISGLIWGLAIVIVGAQLTGPDLIADLEAMPPPIGWVLLALPLSLAWQAIVHLYYLPRRMFRIAGYSVVRKSPTGRAPVLKYAGGLGAFHFTTGVLVTALIAPSIEADAEKNRAALEAAQWEPGTTPIWREDINLPEPPDPVKPVRAGGGIAAPAIIKRVEPHYPPIALSARIQGTVIIDVTIGGDGKVKDAMISRSIILLDHYALEAVRQWEFEPTIVNGAAIPVIHTVEVEFTQIRPARRSC